MRETEKKASKEITVYKRLLRSDIVNSWHENFSQFHDFFHVPVWNVVLLNIQQITTKNKPSWQSWSGAFNSIFYHRDMITYLFIFKMFSVLLIISQKCEWVCMRFTRIFIEFIKNIFLAEWCWNVKVTRKENHHLPRFYCIHEYY